MSKSDCIVGNQDRILTNGSNLNIDCSFDGEDRWICFPCFEKNLDYNENGGGLRIFEKYSVCELCFEVNCESMCISCFIKVQHSKLNGFLTVGAIRPV